MREGVRDSPLLRSLHTLVELRQVCLVVGVAMAVAACAPSSEGTGDNPATSHAVDGGSPLSGTVGPRGGAVSRLHFAVVGDTRPPTVDDTSGYPVATIAQIYEHIAALSPRPSFVVSTGDYMFASPRGQEGATQLDLYLAARARYSGPLFPAMGNHECTGLTASNCGSGNLDGMTNNFVSFAAKLLAPVQQSTPHYQIDIHSTADAKTAQWTAKFLFVAANAWSAEQATWLERAMSRATTYTFVVRHEPARATAAPGVLPSETIMGRHPYTLCIVGHSHTYERSGLREVLVGNGGAPLSGSKNYGFAILSQRADGTIAVDMIDLASGLPDGSFHFALKPDGSAAP